MPDSYSTVLGTRSAPPVCIEDSIERAWLALAQVEDPEIPALSIVDLGLIRYVQVRSDGALEVGVSPTYVGCPATEVIQAAIVQALARAEVGEVALRVVLSPAWSSDWITDQGRHQLLAYGIVPPEKTVASLRDLVRMDKLIACPRCHSIDTETVSNFGSTPCKALHRCRACLEPFEYFKCI